jgi:acyl-CoA synthetase (AMP-forming)/AMP-acid ligase II
MGATGVVYCGTNDASFPIAVFGAAYAGLPFIPLNYRLGEEQLQPLVEANRGAVVIAETAKIPGAEHAVIPAAGHITALENPADFMKVLKDFLGRHN